jgi:hypothetical protein
MPLQWPLRWVLFVLRVISKGIGLWNQRGLQDVKEGGVVKEDLLTTTKCEILSSVGSSCYMFSRNALLL